ETVSNHFTGLSLGPPLGDQRLDLCDLYAFLAPTDPTRTVIILNANPNADALHPDAIYRLNIDNDGDLLTDVALSYVFSTRAAASRLSTCSWREARNRARPKPSARRSLPMQRSHSAPRPTSSRQATTNSSPAVAATHSSSILTASRISSTQAASGISRSLT